MKIRSETKISLSFVWKIMKGCSFPVVLFFDQNVLVRLVSKSSSRSTVPFSLSARKLRRSVRAAARLTQRSLGEGIYSAYKSMAHFVKYVKSASDATYTLGFSSRQPSFRSFSLVQLATTSASLSLLLFWYSAVSLNFWAVWFSVKDRASFHLWLGLFVRGRNNNAKTCRPWPTRK